MISVIRADRGQWLITVYLLVTSIVVPAAGFLVGRFSTRTLFFASGGAFITGTLLAAVSSGYAPLLAGRLIQGVGAGLLMPLFQTTILRVFPKEKMGTAMGIVGLVMGLAPALGPVLSGFALEDRSWRILFYGVLPIAAANLLLAYLTLRNVGERSSAKLDLLSLLYSSVGFSSLLYGLGSLGGSGTAGYALPAIAAGATGAALFVRRQSRLAEPLLDFGLLRSRSFRLASWIGAILFFVMIGTELFLPLYAQNVAGLTPRESGLMLLPGALLFGLSGVVSGRLYDRFGAALLTRLAFGAIAASLLLMTCSIRLDASPWLLTSLFALFMVGVGFVMSPITAYAMSGIPAEQIRHASPMTIMIRSFSGAVSGAVLVAVATPVTDLSVLPVPENTRLGITAAFGILTACAAAGLAVSLRLEGRRGRGQGAAGSPE
ncbi:DHA2 family efflux MFS transporter permease subunit [Saccharibacillus qingshengii]|uniref:DHA2 family efflux MFS transporter permease subunit n=1 Tax=Saccharibacillus qingshengii TaxID=1763540 RepID=UPI001FE90E9B|nr:DHA2 family efflux MFS transporter permease subunit [Saccharibacillus qingshengii]